MRMRIMRRGKPGGSDDIDIAIRRRRIFIADVSTDSRNITVFRNILVFQCFTCRF